MVQKIYFWSIDFDATSSCSYLTLSGEIEIRNQDGIKFLHPRTYGITTLNLRTMEATTAEEFKFILTKNDESEIDYFWLQTVSEEVDFMTKIIGQIPGIVEDWSIIISEEDGYLLLESPTLDQMAKTPAGVVGHHWDGNPVKIALSKLDLINMSAYTYRVYPNYSDREIEIPLGRKSRLVNLDLIKICRTKSEVIK